MKRPFAVITAIVLGLIGLFFVLLGGRLALLGGSLFYLPFGIGLIATGVLAWKNHAATLYLFAVLLLATLGWALAESGLEFWGLEVRLLMPVLLGVWLLLVGQGHSRMPLAVAVTAYVLLLAGSYATRHHHEIRGTLQRAPLASPPDAAASDWPQYGGGARSDRFSSLTQITPANVSKLEVAWTLRTGDRKTRNTFEAPATKVGDTLYFCSGNAWVFAVDPVTGKVKWRFASPKPSVRAVACRGVTHGVVDAIAQGAACRARIFAPATDARIVALDAATGKVCEDFGDKGFIDLKKGLGVNALTLVGLSSPPLFIRNRLVAGLYVSDNVHDREPSGVVRGFDPQTGAQIWSWDVGRTPSNKPLEAGEIYTPGTPNTWGVITGDAALGLVFLPTGSSTPDYFGGLRRPFDDKYSAALVALDAETGLERWHFQTVHHDLWDMDVPIGPSLIDFDGKPALLQTTKRGEVFVLDRATGKPLSRVEEKPNPAGDVRGEYYAPTQPWNVGMESISAPPVKESDSWGATLLDQLVCRVEYRSLRYDGPMTAPSLEGSLVYPAYFGLSDWAGAAVDPGRQLAFLNLNYIPWTVRLVPQGEAVANKLMQPWDGKGKIPGDLKPGVFPQYGTPYAAQIRSWLNPIGVPCLKPPFGEMAALDLKTRKILWKRPLGTTKHSGPFGLDGPLALPTGIFTVGGPISTASGLVFMAGGIDRQLRALDAASGDELWRAPLPAPGAATPTTYMGRDGRQYVVIAAGGHWAMGKIASDQLIAYALPKRAD